MNISKKDLSFKFIVVGDISLLIKVSEKHEFFISI